MDDICGYNVIETKATIGKKRMWINGYAKNFYDLKAVVHSVQTKSSTAVEIIELKGGYYIVRGFYDEACGYFIDDKKGE